MEEKGFKIHNFFRPFYGFRNILSLLPARINSSFDFSIFRLKKGFTLIELLVVIAIIGILSTAAMILINPATQLAKSRDGRRKSDLKLIQAALELYRSDNGIYPTATVDSNNVNTAADCPLGSPYSLVVTDGTCTDGGTVYMQNVPKDPKTGLNYYYIKDTPAGGYTIYSCLENISDTSQLSSSTSPQAPTSSTITQAMQCPAGSVYYGVTNP